MQLLVACNGGAGLVGELRRGAASGLMPCDMDVSGGVPSGMHGIEVARHRAGWRVGACV